MATKIFADVVAFAAGLQAAVDMRITGEREGYEGLNSDKQKVVDEKCAKIRRYHKRAASDEALALMFAAGFDVDFINTKGTLNIYAAEKIFGLAEFLVGGTAKLTKYDLVQFRTLVNFANAGKPCLKAHLQQAQDKVSRKSDNEDLVFTLPNWSVTESTSHTQYGSTKTMLKIFGMLNVTMCADTGNTLYSLKRDSATAQALAKRLGLTLNAE